MSGRLSLWRVNEVSGIELVARWNIAGINYLDLMRDSQGFFYRWHGKTVRFSARNREEAMQTCEKLIGIHFNDANVKKEEL